jgi:hypothetical protein
LKPNPHRNKKEQTPIHFDLIISMAVKKKTKIPKLPPITGLLEESLLKDIEATGLAFDEISLVELCNKKEVIYGPPSSDIRRAIQKYFYKLKSRTTHRR